ncbi:MAG: 2-hydroxymuconate tautomerase family protein [Ramlibacter sp.]|nr:2-hydroxymuconate tautomerase family protein [Ramlibacter sp.]
MPIVQLNLLEGRSEEMKNEAVVAVTEALVRTLGVRIEQVRIIIHELPPQNFAIGGQTVKMRMHSEGK